MLGGIWLESWAKAQDADWILRTCDLIDFMTPFIPKCVVELLALLLPILKLQIPCGCLDVIKFRSHLKILGPGRVTRGKFDFSSHGDPAPRTCVPLVCSSDVNDYPGWGIPL